MSYLLNSPKEAPMWLGLGFVEGWLALIGHLGSSLANNDTQHSIKGEFDPIDSVRIIWYCGYSMWAYSLSGVPQTIGWWSPNPSFLLFHLHFYLLQVYGALMSAIEAYSRIYYSLHQFQVNLYWSPCFTYAQSPLLVKIRAYCPLIL